MILNDELLEKTDAIYDELIKSEHQKYFGMAMLLAIEEMKATEMDLLYSEAHSIDGNLELLAEHFEDLNKILVKIKQELVD